MDGLRIIVAGVQQTRLEAGAAVDPPTTIATAAIAVHNPLAGRGRVEDLDDLEALGREAERRLAATGYRNVVVRIGDGYAGWPEHAPFDAIVVTAGAPHVPEPLVAQLKPGGRMVIPVDAGAFGQDLVLIRKSADGSVSRTVVLPVRFVPLTGPGVRDGRGKR